MKRHIVPFSGGFDSTSILLSLVKRLDEARNPSDKKNSNNDCFTFEPTRVDNDDEIWVAELCHANTRIAKVNRERTARESILLYLNIKYPNVHIFRLQVNISVEEEKSNINGSRSNGGLSQPILWVSSLMPFLYDGDVVYFGYNSTDEMPNRLNDLENLFKYASRIQGYRDYDKIKIKTPLIYDSEDELLFDLFSEDEKLFNLCTSCESQNITNHMLGFCGNCIPCRHKKRSLFELMATNDENMQNFAKEYLKKWFSIDCQMSIIEDESKK